MEITKDKEFLQWTSSQVDKFVAVSNRNVEVQKDAQSHSEKIQMDWQQKELKAFYAKMVLSASTLVVGGLLTWFDKIEHGLAGVIFTAIVVSLGNLSQADRHIRI